jgi:hypothetical protein
LSGSLSKFTITVRANVRKTENLHGAKKFKHELLTNPEKIARKAREGNSAQAL